MKIKKIIQKDIQSCLKNYGCLINIKPLITKNKHFKLHHYQLNNILNISKILNIDIYKLSQNIILSMQNKKMYKSITFSHPGFINILLDKVWICEKLEEIFFSARLGIGYVTPKNVVIDYSSPNIAKEMHIGHLRSTIIGDVMARVLDFLGHNVIRANHIGDWGTQFGMLIAYLKEKKMLNDLKKKLFNLKDIEKFYRYSKKKYDSSKTFARISRKNVVKLQKGDKDCLSIWKKLVSITLFHNNILYKKLNVTLNNNHIMGESFYNDMLEDIVIDLQRKKIAITKNGSVIVLLEEFKNRKGDSMGVIIQKKDKGFLYSTIDIACLKYRYQKLHADRIIYYTDSRQHQYLMHIWTIAKKAHYIPKHLLLEHHMFGMILAKNKHPFKTRDGNVINLSDLLDQAILKARKLVKNKNPNLSKKNLALISLNIGIGAVKYADLSKNRNTNYVFDWDQMLSFDGNTAPYVQYAYTRILSIFKRSCMKIKKLKNKIFLTNNNEICLAIKILEFEEIVTLIAKKGTPHLLCTYLYQLSTCFSSFYENSSVLFAKTIKISQSRLKLSFLTAKTLKKGLNLLGIKTVKNM